MTFGGTGPGRGRRPDRRRRCHAPDRPSACDAGINFIDTADVYSDGLSEEILGEALRHGRDERAARHQGRACRWATGPNDAGLSRHHIIAGVRGQPAAAGTDHIDLYQVHEWDGVTPLEETLEALDSLVRSGKVRYVGGSNYAGWQLMKALGVADRHGYQRFVTQQIYYSLQARDAEYELIPIAVDQGLGVLVWSPLAGGLLSGKYRRGADPPEGTRRLSDWNEPPVHDEEQLYDIVEVLVEIGDGHGVSAAQVALAWLAGRPGVDVADRRRPHRGAARRQPRRGRPRAVRRASSRGSRRSAARRCCIRTGTRPRRPRTGSPRPTSRSWARTWRGSLSAMPQPRRRLPMPEDVQWTQLRRRATLVFVMLAAGWSELSSAERNEARKLISKSRGRPRNLTRAETKRLGALAGRAARAAARAHRRRR